MENTTFIDKTAIQAMLDERVQAIRNKDLDGAVAHYSDDAVVFDIIDPLQHKEVGSIRTRLATWLSSFEGTIGYELRDLEIATGDEACWCRSLNHVDAKKRDGGQLNMWWRETLCWRNINGEWLITHAHSSVPFDLDTGQASVGLKPDDANTKDANMPSHAELVKKSFHAYETQDRKMIEDLLHEDFIFSSPQDDYLDKSTYMQKCWPFSEEHPRFDLQRIAAGNNDIIVNYTCEVPGKMKFQNTEIMSFADDRIKSVEVYFGRNL
ncbi:MAG TPA: nuclear transport factor 2 family protein [Puia sp.]|nr:nuclear transport factor 2 family protein [Puia sp.]